MIFIHPCKKGGHVELGAALALRKPVIIINEKDESGNVIETNDCVFYHDMHIKAYVDNFRDVAHYINKLIQLGIIK